MTTYKRIDGATSEVEPKEETKYGNGIDYNINIQRGADGLFHYSVLRFDNEEDYIRYRKING